jgi:predicted nucleic acid-binding protein
MGRVNYLLDTNAIIDYLGGRLPEKGMIFLDEVVNNIPQISFVTHIELLSFKSTEKHESILKDFINDSVVHYIHASITEKTVDIRKAYAIKVPDAIIAATAIHHNLTLVTRNIKDFDKISDLKLLNPHLI